MVSAREPTIVEDPIGTETAHVWDCTIYSSARRRAEDLLDVSAKTVTFIVKDSTGTPVVKSFTGVDVSLGVVRFTFAGTEWVTAGGAEAQLFVDGVLVHEYVFTFKTTLVGT